LSFRHTIQLLIGRIYTKKAKIFILAVVAGGKTTPGYSHQDSFYIAVFVLRKVKWAGDGNICDQNEKE